MIIDVYDGIVNETGITLGDVIGKEKAVIRENEKNVRSKIL